MTVSTTSTKIIYSGNGSTTVFPFSFAIPANPQSADIQVFFTDSFGNITLLAPTVYTLSFNAASPPNPTPVGGSVTYNPGGSPIPIGTLLTIVRTDPLTQPTTLSNQTAFFQQTIEAAIDAVLLGVQQVSAAQSQSIIVPVSDPSPSPLPVASVRANQIMGFDALGNPTVLGVLPTGGAISAAMAPVCAASTLAAARTDMGLGNIAVENIGAGLVDDGSGNLIINTSITTLALGTPTFNAVKANYGQAVVIRSVGSVINLAQSSTLFNGWGITFTNNASGAVALNINAADSFNGMPTGQAFKLAAGAIARISTNGAGTWYVGFVGTGPNYEVIQNYSLSATVASGALTINLLDAAGNVPSIASPVIISSCLTFGILTQAIITSPVTITVPLGATLGTQNGIPARIWIGLTGSVLCVYVALAQSAPGVPSSILSWSEGDTYSTTAISAGSTSPQVWYASSSLGAQQIRIIGYIEVTTPTAGNWTVTPNTPVLYAHGNRKPGDVVQTVFNLINTLDSTTSATFVVMPHNEITISPQNISNPLFVEFDSSLSNSANNLATVQLSRGVVNNAGLIGSKTQSNSGAVVGATLVAFDMPATLSATTYAVQGEIAGGSTLFVTGAGALKVQEIFV